MNWKWNVVIGENETGFRGSNDVLYRTEAWDFLLAGGALYNNLDYSFTPKCPDGSFSGYKSPGGGSAALRIQLGVLKRFLERFDFVRMRPSPDVIAKIEPKLTSYALVEEGKQYAIYLHVPLPNKPKNLEHLLGQAKSAKVSLRLPQGVYQVEWVDVMTGDSLERKTISHGGGTCHLSSPEFTNDIALRIQSR
jgi:hypothetical protein